MEAFNRLTPESRVSVLQTSDFPFFLPPLIHKSRLPFPFAFSIFFPAGFVSPPEVHWRGRYAPEAEVSFLSSLVSSPSGSSSGKGRAVGPTVAANRSGSPISNGGLRTRITFAVFMRCKRKSTERAPTTGSTTVSIIPTTCGATRLASENGANG